jgi:glycosyltransferase involved in cell wall biosynthesis
VSINSAKLGIILCTFNPDLTFLKKQIISISSQTFDDFHIYVSDDCSSKELYNGIIEIMEEFVKDKYTVTSRQENNGFAKNFLISLNEIPHHEFYCFSDQDDIWFKDKLTRGINNLSNCDLYCSSTELINENDQIIGLNKLQIKPSFEHSLVQSIAGGNTYVFNHNVRSLICSRRINTKIPSHDWFMYQVVIASGLRVIYDDRPTIQYRLHSRNIIGTNNTLYNKAKRLIALFKGTFKEWNNSNILLISFYLTNLTAKNKKTFFHFSKNRDGSVVDRLALFFHLKIRRASFLQNIALIAGLIFKKI